MMKKLCLHNIAKRFIQKEMSEKIMKWSKQKVSNTLNHFS